MGVFSHFCLLRRTLTQWVYRKQKTSKSSFSLPIRPHLNRIQPTHLPRKWDVMVDLFFYREPEEAKEREEEEVAQAEYVPTFTLGAEQWPTEVADAQWESEAPAVPGIVPPVAGADWMAAPVPDAVGWDMAAAPAIPAAVAAGWDAAMPAVAAGWDAAPVPQQPLAGVGAASWEPAPAAPSSWAPQ